MALIVLGAAALILVLVAAVRLMRLAEDPDDARAQFGRPLLVGALVGLSFMPAQAALQAELKARDADRLRETAAEEERRDLLLQLSLRQNLPGIDLRGRRLAGIYMFGKNLSGANLRGADLRRANLSHANLRSAQLQGARLDDAVLLGADMREVELDGTSFTGADLTRARLGLIAWSGEPDVDLQFDVPDSFFRVKAAEGPPADFTEADLTFARFSRADLSHARFVGATLLGTEFTDVILHGARFDHGDAPTFLTRVDLCRASFRASTFGGVHYDGVSLRRADLSGATLEEGGFFDVDFRGADTAGLSAPTVDLTVGQEEKPLVGFDTLQTEGRPELTRNLALALDASDEPPAPEHRCSWVIFRNRLRPLALRLPDRPGFG